jgi:glutamyl/glutaminyl-tRNA synthetase
LDLDIVPDQEDSFNLHMRLGHEEHSRRTLSVDEHEEEKSKTKVVASVPRREGTKLCSRLPMMSRFDRVQRSLRAVKDGEKHANQIKQNFTNFLEGLKRKDLQGLAKEHGIKANMKTAKLVKELVKVFTAASEELFEERVVEEEEIVEEKDVQEEKVVEEEQEDSEAKEVLECHNWKRKKLQTWCKRVGIKANSKTAVLIKELKAHYA